MQIGYHAPVQALAARQIRAPAILFAAALILQGILLYINHFPELRPLRGDEIRYHNKAVQLASGKIPKPDLVWPPLYHILVGAVYRVFGIKRLPLEVFQTVLLLLSAYIFYRLMLISAIGTGAANAGLFLFLLDPQIASFAQFLWPEIVHLFLVFLMLGLLFLWNGKWISLFASGLCLGAVILTKSLLLPFSPVLILAAALQAKEAAISSRVKAALLFTAGMLVLVLPVTIHNGVRHGFWGISDSGTFNLWLGLKGDRYAAEEFRDYERLSDNPSERNRILRERIADKFHKENILEILNSQFGRQYFRLFNKDSFLIEQFPGGRWQFKSNSDDNFVSLLTGWSYFIYSLTLVLSMIGIFQIRREDWKKWALPFTFLLFNLLLYLFLYTRSRYRVAFLPAMIYFAAFGLKFLLRSEKDKLQIFRLIAGSATALAFVYFAFASEAS